MTRSVLKRPWTALTPPERRRRTVAALCTAALQLTLLVATWRDLARRPASQVRGPKNGWRAAAFINFFGPLAYFLFGRKRPEHATGGAT